MAVTNTIIFVFLIFYITLKDPWLPATERNSIVRVNAEA